MKIKLLFAITLILSLASSCHRCPPCPPCPTPSPLVDTTKYTDVVLINNSQLDSVQVFLTLQSSESIIGLFGMDSSNIVTYCGGGTPCVGSFWAKKGIQYHLGDTNTVSGAIVTWGVQNQSCPAAQKIGYPFGINNFEFTVNTWWQGGIVTGANEAADITCVDGLHSELSMSVTSNGPRNGNSPNFGAFWDFGYTDSTGLVPFTNVTNGTTLSSCVNLPGVFPYGCDLGYRQSQPPTPCTTPSYPVKCSDKWGQINTSQLNRQGQGGAIKVIFYGFTDANPAGVTPNDGIK